MGLCCVSLADDCALTCVCENENENNQIREFHVAMDKKFANLRRSPQPVEVPTTSPSSSSTASSKIDVDDAKSAAAKTAIDDAKSTAAKTAIDDAKSVFSWDFWSKVCVCVNARCELELFIAHKKIHRTQPQPPKQIN